MTKNAQLHQKAILPEVLAGSRIKVIGTACSNEEALRWPQATYCQCSCAVVMLTAGTPNVFALNMLMLMYITKVVKASEPLAGAGTGPIGMRTRGSALQSFGAIHSGTP